MMPDVAETRVGLVDAAELWPRIREAPYRLLGLDYDGTLAPFRVERMAAKPEPGSFQVLADIRDAQGTDVLVISGRPVADLLELVGDIGIRLIGAHGREVRGPDGTLVTFPPSETQREGLAQALTVATSDALGSQLERKIASIALHVRGLANPEDVLARGITLWQPLATAHELELRQFNGGVELRAKGRHKGSAFAEVLRQMPPGTLPVYIGDDDTDEDAFTAIQETGIGIKVGGRHAATAAAGWLPDPAHVIRFLEEWLTVIHRR